MILYIRGASFANMGAHLMLDAVLERIRAWSAGIEPVLDLRAGTMSQIRRKGTGVLLWRPSPSAPFLSALFDRTACAIPRPLRRRAKTYAFPDIDVTLDCSGFAYSSQWGVYHTVNLANEASRLKKAGKKHILLPQAFGPFREERIKDALKRAISNIDLVYARDSESYSYLVQVVGDQPNIRQCPDFTIPLEPRGEWPQEELQQDVAIVPNYRMIDMTQEGEGEAYLRVLQWALDQLITLGRRPFFLIHDSGKDEDVVRLLVSRGVRPIPVFKHPDPHRLKAALGSCELVIGSRYHALAGALSRVVPCIGLGWSHKYTALFTDFGVGDLLLPTSAPEEVVRRAIDRLCDPMTSAGVRQTLVHNVARQRCLVDEMWASVREEIA